MGAAIARLFRSFDKRERRIAMLGLDNSGKTTILYRLNIGDVVTTIPTIGFNVERVEVPGALSMQVWDIGGQDKIRPLWRHYYHNTEGIIFVIDSTDKDRIEESAEEFHKLLQEKDLQNIPILIFANKQDLPNPLKAAEIAEKMGVSKVTGNQVMIQPSSAANGFGLHEGIRWLANTIKTRK
eukprot:TRINITY_DN109_c0_g2_i4.p1 TRINITY_DN109_c0_g2~~TRINITY_DN109_c0_g2_i4.p1  ORF type:complete len:182 (+),score=38.58 TRINITY_DN109_c0_g2_i4:257-802(+)